MRRLLQLCWNDPSDTARIIEAATAVSLDELPALQLHDTLAPPGTPPMAGTFRELLQAIRRPTTLALLSTDKVDVTLWALPPRCCLPLHDHPSMTVTNRLFHGKLHELSFDWADGQPAVNAPSQPRRARVVSNHWRTATDPGLLPPRSLSEDEKAPSAGSSPLSRHGGGELPSGLAVIEPDGGGVLHAFTSGDSPVVFLDVISPPYFASPDKLDCTYFDIVLEGEETIAARDADGETYLGDHPVDAAVVLRPASRGTVAPPMDYFTGC